MVPELWKDQRMFSITGCGDHPKARRFRSTQVHAGAGVRAADNRGSSHLRCCDSHSLGAQQQLARAKACHAVKLALEGAAWTQARDLELVAAGGLRAVTHCIAMTPCGRGPA